MNLNPLELSPKQSMVYINYWNCCTREQRQGFVDQLDYHELALVQDIHQEFLDDCFVDEDFEEQFTAVQECTYVQSLIDKMI